MSVINWGETLYALARGIGFAEARVVLANAQPMLLVVDVDQPMTEAAARLKTEYKLHYADCFAAALAGRTGLVVTADPDFKRIRWLRTLTLPAR